MAELYHTPEEIEEIRRYGVAMLGLGQGNDPAMTSGNPYARVSPLSLLVRPMQALQGRSALNMVEDTRGRNRQTRANLSLDMPPVGAPRATTRTSNAGTTDLATGSLPPAGEGGPADSLYAQTLFQIESSNRPELYNSRRTRRGLGQLSSELERQFNVSDFTNRDQQMAAVTGYGNQNAQLYRNQFGRDPDRGTLYLMHQQGPGGSMALLTNPDATAYEALLPVYVRQYGQNRGPQVARMAVEDNLPSHLKSQWQSIKARDFASQWINRFNQVASRIQPQQPIASAAAPNAAPPANPANPAGDGAMRLGGPVAEENMPPVDPNNAAPPTQAQPPVPPIEPSTHLQQQPPQQQGGEFSVAQAGPGGQRPPPGLPPRIPPNPNLEIIERQLQNATLFSGEEAAKLAEQYQQMAGPQTVDTPMGTGYYNGRTGELMYWTPKQWNMPVQTPGFSGQIPMMTGRNGLSPIPMGPASGAQPPGMPPGGAGGPPGGAPGPQGGITPNRNVQPGIAPFPTPTGSVGQDIANYSQWGLTTQNLGEIGQRLAQAQSGRIATAITAGQQATERIQMLNTIRTATLAAANTRWSGETLSNWQDKIATFLYNFSGDKSMNPEQLKDLPYRELLRKLNAFLASEATQEISARGTNFEFATLLRYNPNLMATHEGTMMLIDYMAQEKKKQAELGDIASQIPPERAGDWSRIVRRYYDRNPIYINVPAQGSQPAMRVTTQRIPQIGDIKPDGNGEYTYQEVQQFVDRLPRGVWFINPDDGVPTPAHP